MRRIAAAATLLGLLGCTSSPLPAEGTPKESASPEAKSPAQPPPDAAASDPAKLGWMRGAPPPPEKTLRFFDGSYFRFPAMRWSVSNFRQLMPTVNVSRGLGAPRPLPRALREDLDAVRFTPLGGGAPRP